MKYNFDFINKDKIEKGIKDSLADYANSRNSRKLLHKLFISSENLKQCMPICLLNSSYRNPFKDL